MGIDLSGMSRKELLELQSSIAEALKAAEIRERQAALAALEAAAAEHGFSVAELTGDGRKGTKGTKAVAKYRNPANPEQTWTGRGRKPQWIHDALAAGADITDLEI